MLVAISALKGYSIEASDDRIGTVGDFLFDDSAWRMRWVVVDTGSWLTSRKVLIHPGAIFDTDHEARTLRVDLTKAQVEASPGIGADLPVSQQMEASVYDYYGWEPNGGTGYFSGDMMGSSLGMLPFEPVVPVVRPPPEGDLLERGDQHLRSVAEVLGYLLEASDGAIGHVENLLVDDRDWDIRYLIADTKNWWPGAHVLLSPYAVLGIDCDMRHIRLGMDRAAVKSSPPWDPAKVITEEYEKRLHGHYGWAGYGFAA